jgi:hypothetical protein
MGVVIVVLVIGALVGAVVWNHRNAALAMAGQQFHVADGTDAVTRAIGDAYCGGAKATMKALVSRLTVTPAGPSSFRVTSKIGDAGHINVRPGPKGGSTVEASTDELYVGSHPMTHSRRPGLWGLSSALTHVIYKAVGITPNAARMKRFQRGIERQVNIRLRRQSRV